MISRVSSRLPEEAPLCDLPKIAWAQIEQQFIWLSQENVQHEQSGNTQPEPNETGQKTDHVTVGGAIGQKVYHASLSLGKTK